MKKLLSFLAGMIALVSVCAAGDVAEIVTLRADNLTTNAGITVTNSYNTQISGEVLAIYLDVGAVASPTVTVVVATHSTSGMVDVAQTLLTITDATADAVYPVSDLACSYLGTNITGEAVPFHLNNDILYATFTNGTAVATHDIKAHVLIKRE